MCITAIIKHVFISFSAVQIYDLSYIQLHNLSSNDVKNLNFFPKKASDFILQSFLPLKSKTRNANFLDDWLFILYDSIIFFSVTNTMDRFLYFLFDPNNTINDQTKQSGAKFVHNTGTQDWLFAECAY